MALIKKVLFKQYNINIDTAYCKISNITFNYKQDSAIILMETWANKNSKDLGSMPINIEQLSVPISVIDSMEGATYVSKIYNSIKSVCEDYSEAIDDLDVIAVEETTPPVNLFNI